MAGPQDAAEAAAAEVVEPLDDEESPDELDEPDPEVEAASVLAAGAEELEEERLSVL